jgi:2-aminoadipate transaminase
MCSTPSAIRDICALVTQPEIRSLAGGWPDPAIFPLNEIREIFDRALARNGAQMLQYGSTEGLQPLRTILARRMRNEGIKNARADRLIITHGSAQGMNLAAQVFVDRDDVVLAGLPTYFGGPGAVQLRGGRVVGVPVDQDGMNTTAVAREIKRLTAAGQRVKGVYVIPNFQNPTGVTLSLRRRRRMIQLAEEFDFVIFEDDPYGELRFEGRHLPSLKALDRNNRVMHLRSLSKTFVPGLRLGWVCGHGQAIRKMVVAKQYIDAATNTPAQYMLLDFIRQGLLDRQIQSNISFYRAKRDFMLQQMERHFPSEISWNRPRGGFFIFVHLPPGMDAGNLYRRAVAHKVAFITGQPFYIDGSGRNTFRLSFAQADEASIKFAIQVIGKLIKDSLEEMI